MGGAYGAGLAARGGKRVAWGMGHGAWGMGPGLACCLVSSVRNLTPLQAGFSSGQRELRKVFQELAPAANRAPTTRRISPPCSKVIQ